MARFMLALALILAAPLAAQDTHYWTQQYGGISTLLGGAVIGGCNDTGAGFYNPARLGFINNSHLSASASIYQIDLFSSDDGAGDDVELSSTQARIVPGLVSGIFLFEGAPRHAFGYTLIARQNWGMGAHARRKHTENVIDDARSPGAESYSAQLSLRVALREYWGGLSYSWRFHRYFSVGVTHYGCARLETINFHATSRAVGSTGAVFGADDIYDVDYYAMRMFWKAGVAFDIGWLKAGATLTTPGLNLFGSGSASGNRTFFDVDANGDGTGDSFVLEDRQKGIDPQYRTPFSFGAGIEYTAPSYTRICFSFEWFLPVGEYTVLKPRSKDLNAGVLGTLDSRDVFRVRDQRDGAFNVALGVQQKLSNSLSGLVSFRTDFSTRQELSGIQLGMAGFDMYHAATGLSYRTGKSEFAGGFQFSFSGGKFRQPASLTGVSESRGLFGERSLVHPGYISISIVIGYTYFI